MLGMVVLLTVVYLSLPDPVGMWRRQIEKRVASMQARAARSRAIAM